MPISTPGPVADGRDDSEVLDQLAHSIIHPQQIRLTGRCLNPLVAMMRTFLPDAFIVNSFLP
jgi:hypothetical protein